MCDLLTSSVAGGVALYRGVGNAQSATRHDKKAPARGSRGVGFDSRALDADSDSIRPVYPACTVGSKSDHDRFSAHVLRE